LIDRERLIKLLGLLGSDHNGEIASAGRMADALIRDDGATWADVIARETVQRELIDALRAENEGEDSPTISPEQRASASNASDGLSKTAAGQTVRDVNYSTGSELLE